jgi:hypothetical protein
VADTSAANQPAKQPTDPAVVTADDRRTAVREEYGKYVAIEPIDGPHGDVRIFNVGDPVPVSFVEGKEYPWLSKDDGRVAGANTKQARNASRRAAGLPEEE